MVVGILRRCVGSPASTRGTFCNTKQLLGNLLQMTLPQKWVGRLCSTAISYAWVPVAGCDAWLVHV